MMVLTIHIPKAYVPRPYLWVMIWPRDVGASFYVIKVAYQQGLITDAKAWSELHMKRNLTTHTYDEQLAADIYSWLKKDGILLFSALKKTLSQLS